MGLKMGLLDIWLTELGSKTIQNLGLIFDSAFTPFVNGTDNTNIIISSWGNKLINTGNGNNVVILNQGNNTVNAGDGHDHIVAKAGSGDATLNGGYGNDTYELYKGHGNITLNETYNGYERDTLKFADANSTEVKMRKVGNNLILFGYNGGNTTTINQFFLDGSYSIEKFVFMDKTMTYDDFRYSGLNYVTDDAAVLNGWYGVNIVQLSDTVDQTANMSNFSDVITLGTAKAIVNTNDGDDHIIAKAGSGDATLNGGYGNDTYELYKGHGNITLNETHNGYERDTLKFADANSTEVKMRKVGNNLILFGYNGGNTTTINQFFLDGSYSIEKFVFMDKTLTFDELIRSGIPVFSEQDQAELDAAKAQEIAAAQYAEAMSPASYVTSTDAMMNASVAAQPQTMGLKASAANDPEQAAIANEVQLMINAMASFGTSEGSINIDDQSYNYLTPLTVSNY